jgi:hypothetical protein
MCTSLSAQQRKREDIEAAMIFTMIKYVQWPDELETGDFVIGVVGDTQIFDAMKTVIEGRAKGNKKAIVKNLSVGSDYSSCSVLFVGRQNIKDFESIRNSISTNPILLITDTPQYGKKGSHINFLEVDGKVRYELNMKLIDKTNLKVASQLTVLAILI